MPGLQGWAETRKTDREGRRPPIGEGRVEFREAVERTGTGSPIDESAPMMDVGCSSLSRKQQREEAGFARLPRRLRAFLGMRAFRGGAEEAGFAHSEDSPCLLRDRGRSS